MEIVARFFQQGGMWMYVIAMVSVFACAVMIERSVYYYFFCKINGKLVLSQISRLIARGEFEKSRKIVSELHSPLAAILESALWHFMQHESNQNIQNAVEEVGLREIPKINRRTHYLSLCANISTLLGLLGTIFGLQDAFSAISTADPAQKSAVLAQGISIAMNTTALGLMVAVCCMIMFSILGAKANMLLEETEECTVRFLNHLFSLRKF